MAGSLKESASQSVPTMRFGQVRPKVGNAFSNARIELIASTSIGEDYVIGLPPLKKPNKNASLPIQHMVTRTKDGTRKCKMYSATRHPLHAALTTLSSTTEPTCFNIAAKSPEWHASMAFEFHALQQNGTWSLC